MNEWQTDKINFELLEYHSLKLSPQSLQTVAGVLLEGEFIYLGCTEGIQVFIYHFKYTVQVRLKMTFVMYIELIITFLVERTFISS